MIKAKHMPENLSHGALAVTAGLLLAASSPVFAHHPMGGMTPETFSQGLLSGLGHPILGLDHFAFMVVAMLLACMLKGSARFVAPLAFVGASAAGTVMHLGAANIPMAEALVALSVIVGGVLVLFRRYPGALALSGLFAVSGILHGYTLGESIIGAETTPLLAYLAGLAAIQYLMIAGGVLALEKLASKSEKARLLAARVGGIAATLTGGIFLAMGVM